MDTFLQDARFAVRSLLRTPSFTAVAVLALALGIGANTAIFTAVNALLLQPLPFKDPDSLIWIADSRRGTEKGAEAFSVADVADFQQQAKSLSGLAGWDSTTTTLTGDGDAEVLQAITASTSLFRVLGVSPVLGRDFTADDEGPRAGRVAILSHAAWVKRFAGDKTIIGRSLTLDGRPATVVGVLPPGFRFPLDSVKVEVYTPLGQTGVAVEIWAQRGAHFMSAVGRLAPGVSLAQAEADLGGISRSLAERYPDTNATRMVRLAPLARELSGDVRPALLVLLAAVGFVLLIACGNVANLLLARATGRQRELAVRAALGASRLRVVRQLLTESLLLGLVGGGCGLLLALWGTDLLRSLAPQSLSRLRTISVDGLVLAFTAGVSILTAVLFGLVPALVVSRPDLHETLKSAGGRGSSSSGHHRLRSALIVIEIALSLTLLVGAGLLGRSFQRLLHVDPGFRTEGVLSANLDLPRERYPTAVERTALLTRLVAAMRGHAGVIEVATAGPLPLTGNNVMLSMQIPGRPRSPGEDVTAEVYAASDGFFATLGIPLLRGRLVTAAEVAAKANLCVVSEELARRYFPGEEAIGKTLRIGGDRGVAREIVGIVGDVRHRSLERPALPSLFIATQDAMFGPADISIKAKGSLTPIANALRSEVRALDPGLALDDVRPYAEVLANTLAARRFNLTLLGIFAAVALALAAVGIYGVMSYSVSQRTREMGIRMALGAARGDVLHLVLVQGMRLTALGVVSGLAAALALTRLLSQMIYGVTASDPITYAVLALVVLGVALLASWLPARRATRVPPAVALGAE